MPRTKKKVKSIVKTKVISARVTEVVHELLHQQAEDAGMTLSEFAAQMLMKGRVNTSYVFYVHPDEIEAITREFAAIGNNLNQIAGFFNSGGIQSRAMLENINHAISCIGHSGGWMRKSRKSKRKDLRQTRQNFKRRNSLSGMPLPLLVRKQSRMKIFKTSCRMNMTFSSKHNVDVTAICHRNGTSSYRSVPWGTVAKENVWKDSSFRTQREIYGTRKTPY